MPRHRPVRRPPCKEEHRLVRTQVGSRQGSEPKEYMKLWILSEKPSTGNGGDWKEWPSMMGDAATLEGNDTASAGPSSTNLASIACFQPHRLARHLL